MPPSGKRGARRNVNRRTILRAIGIASTAGVISSRVGAQEGGDDLGERVPTLTFQYWSDQGPPTVLFEETISNIEAVSGELGFSLEPSPMTTGQGIEEVGNDTRAFHVAVNSHGPSANRLDPTPMMNGLYHIENAGANGAYNPTNYASCEFSEFADAQSTEADPDERQSLVNQGMEVFSTDIAFVPTIERPTTAALNTDLVEEVDVGAAGFSDTHFAAMNEAGVQTRGGADAVICNLPTEHLTSSFYPTVSDGDSMGLYASLTHSPLVGYDSNYELTPMLAENYEVDEDTGSITFTISQDAVFHNGDPVTPEDVKWTYEFLAEQFNEGNYPFTELPADLSIEIVDDRTVRTQTDEPAPGLLSGQMAIYGVLPQGPYVNAGIEENPTDFDDPMIGAGPYQIDSYTNQQNMALSPSPEGHPVYEVNSPILFQLYENTDGVVRAFENQELNVAVALHPEAGVQLEESMSGSVQVIRGFAHLPFGFMPQQSFAPGMFKEFRQALSYAVDRQGLNETYAFGESEVVTLGTMFSSEHPWHNPDVLTEIGEETRNLDRAREVLEEAGWGWDDNGNLHYPPDAELVAWPEGETPDPEDFPCLE